MFSFAKYPGPGAGGGRKRRGKKGNLPNTFDDDCSLFIGFLVEKYVACRGRKSDFEWHRFRFSPCLMRKRVEKSDAILALLGGFQCISNGKPE